MSIWTYQGSFIGSRKEQQDAHVMRLFNDGTFVAGVFDGLGGEPNGQAASRAAVACFRESLSADSAMTQLPTAVAESRGYTTASIVTFSPVLGHAPRVVHVHNVGDSPIWHVSPGGVIRVLHQDPYGSDSHETMCLPLHPLGARVSFHVMPGDRVFVCTDGIRRRDLERLVDEDERDYHGWAERLSKREGSDNVTFIVVEFV